MKINNRLRSVASLVSCNTSIIDVGCDHALLSIYLYLNKENVKVIASDINEGPLNKARENIKKYDLDDKIDVILNDGIKNLDGFDTVIISGMGGLTVIDILENGNLENVNNIIVSPNNDEDIVREKITKLGYYIDDELLIKEKGKYYFVISFKKGKKNKINYKYSEILLKKKDKTYIEYLTNEINKNKGIINKLDNKHLFLKFKLFLKNKKIKNIVEKYN